MLTQPAASDLSTFWHKASVGWIYDQNLVVSKIMYGLAYGYDSKPWFLSDYTICLPWTSQKHALTLAQQR